VVVAIIVVILDNVTMAARDVIRRMQATIRDTRIQYSHLASESAEFVN
jgi:hypothetical protein